MSATMSEVERLQRRIAYMQWGPGRPAKHKFADGGDSDVTRWRAEHDALVARLRVLLAEPTPFNPPEAA